MSRTADNEPEPGAIRPRWLLAIGGLAISVLDTVAAIALDVELSLNGSDITFYIWIYLALSFGGLGFLLGVLLEQRQRARAAKSAIAQQMTRLGTLQARLSQAEKLATLGQLSATIAHEIRNPLAVIRSSVQNIAEVAGDEARESCQFALTEIDRLNRVTSSMLDFARPLQPQCERVAVLEVFERVQLLATPLLADKQLQLIASTMDDEPGAHLEPKDALTADMDLDLVCQALIGLIANAAAVSQDGQSVTLEACRTDDDQLALSVVDRGPGVPEEARERLFEPFFTTGKRGNGLGLAVVRDIARAHQGDVAVFDREGGGARFTLTLPRAVA